MKTKTVKDMMTPLSKYGTISAEATLYEAAMALNTAQQEYDRDRSRHRLLLIVDEQGHVVGKLSQLDVLRAGVVLDFLQTGEEKDYRSSGLKDKALRLNADARIIAAINFAGSSATRQQFFRQEKQFVRRTLVVLTPVELSN